MLMNKTVFFLGILIFASCTAPERGAEPAQREVIATEKAPAAIGPYSQAIRHGNTLYLAGQVGIDPATGKLVEGGLEDEARQAMDNLAAVLEEAGFSFDDVVEVQVFLADIEDFGAFNEVYAPYFGEGPPARAVVGVEALPIGARVEIKMTAVKTGRQLIE